MNVQIFLAISASGFLFIFSTSMNEESSECCCALSVGNFYPMDFRLWIFWTPRLGNLNPCNLSLVLGIPKGKCDVEITGLYVVG